MDIDSLWLEMKSERAQKANKETAAQLMKRLNAKKNAAPSSTAFTLSTKFRSPKVPSASPSISSDCPTCPLDEGVKGTSEEVTSMVIKLLQKNINATDDVSGPVRKAALERLSVALFSDGSKPKNAGVIAGVFRVLFKQLIKRFADHVECCREMSMSLMISFLNEGVDIGLCLPFMMPAIRERIPASFGYDPDMQVFVLSVEEHSAVKRGKAFEKPTIAFSHSVVELSEEIRLKLVHLLLAVLQAAKRHDVIPMLNPYMYDLVIVLANMVNDPFAEVKKAACETLVFLSAVQPEAGKAFSIALVRWTMQCLNHRHAKVRLAALDCVDCFVSVEDKAKCKGAGTEAIVDLVGYKESNVLSVAAFYVTESRVNYFAFLIKDKNPSVRLHFIKMVGRWMTTLPDRFDHQTRLLPYILGALHDESAEVGDEALAVLEGVGREYEAEHADEVVEKRQYGMESAPHVNHAALPPPHKHRPRMGTRGYVQSNVRRFLLPVLAELGTWKSLDRGNASSLLITIVKNIHSEEIGAKTLKAAALAGRFIPPDTYVEMLLPKIRHDSGGPLTTSARAANLAVLTAMLSGSKPSFASLQLSPVATALLDCEILLSPDKALRVCAMEALARVSGILAETGIAAMSGAAFSKTGRLPDADRLILTVIESCLLLRSDNTLAVASDKCLESIRVACEFATLSDLLIAYAPTLLDQAIAAYPTSSMWKESDPCHVTILQLLVVMAGQPPMSFKGSRDGISLAKLLPLLRNLIQASDIPSAVAPDSAPLAVAAVCHAILRLEVPTDVWDMSQMVELLGVLQDHAWSGSGTLASTRASLVESAASKADRIGLRESLASLSMVMVRDALNRSFPIDARLVALSSLVALAERVTCPREAVLDLLSLSDDPSQSIRVSAVQTVEAMCRVMYAAWLVDELQSRIQSLSSQIGRTSEDEVIVLMLQSLARRVHGAF